MSVVSDKKAKDFLSISSQFKLGSLVTIIASGNF